MTFDEAKRTRFREIFDTQIDDLLDGLTANLDSLDGRPANKEAGQRIRSHLIDLERLITIRNGL